MRLSPHFTLAEFTRSDIARRLGIDNTPPPEIVGNLRVTAAHMEQVRLALDGAPIHVSSGYRSEALERALCAKAWAAWCARHNMVQNGAAWRAYVERKAHPKGCAVDFTAPDFGTPLQVCRRLAGMAEALGFDQLIWEFEDWVHIAWSEQPRLQVLTIDQAGTRAGLPLVA